ncbi:MAG: DUF2271 domain-containing protein [Isosphaeraceae bacterium]
MLRRSSVRLILASLPLILGVSTRARAGEEFAFFHENILGTSLEIRVVADSRTHAQDAERRILNEIERLAGIFSTYDATSEFSRWQAGVGRESALSPELFEVLRACERWTQLTSGAFDPRVEVVSRLWAVCEKAQREPTSDELAGLRARLAEPAWQLTESGRLARRLSDVPLSLNAIAKGEIVDRATNAGLVGGPGVEGLLVAVGGDLRVRGDYTRRIGIADPRRDSETTEPLAHVNLRGKALATSGGYQRGFQMGARRYSHIVDPRTLQPASHVLGSTVIAETTAAADALATAFSVLPVEESLRLAESLPGVACLIIPRDGPVVRSQGWQHYEAAGPVRVSLRREIASPEASETWAERFEMRVGFEINRPTGNTRGLRRPYVAVWVEDRDGVPVRTLILWVQKGGPGPRWIPDLKRWYRGDGVRKLVDDTDLVETVSRATRPPGKYEAIWDGKDDAGHPVKPGKYTLWIEAAREHGTYQLISHPLDLADTAFAADLKGNIEIKSARVEYRRKANAQ